MVTSVHFLGKATDRAAGRSFFWVFSSPTFIWPVLNRSGEHFIYFLHLHQQLLWSVDSFLLKKKFIFNWRIIALQYCVGFCHTTTWISRKHTRIPTLLSLPPHPPSRLSQSTQLSSPCYMATSHWSSVSHTVTTFQCYSVHFPHPLLLRCAHKSVVSVCISIPALHIGSLVPFF